MEKFLKDIKINLYFALTFGMAITVFYPVAAGLYFDGVFKIEFSLIDYIMLGIMYLVIFFDSECYKDFNLKNILKPVLGDAGYIDLFGYTFLLIPLLELIKMNINAENFIYCLLIAFSSFGIKLGIIKSLKLVQKMFESLKLNSYICVK